GLGILADDLGRELALVEQPHMDLVGVSGHMIVGQDIAVGRDDHARAESVLLVFMGNLAEKAAELIERILLLTKRPAGTLLARPIRSSTRPLRPFRSVGRVARASLIAAAVWRPRLYLLNHADVDHRGHHPLNQRREG